MSGDSGEHFKIRPLTRVGPRGGVLERRKAVSAQIRSLSGLSWNEITSRLAIPNRSDQNYLKNETLVHLIREALLQNQDPDPDRSAEGLENALLEMYEELQSRMQKYLRKSRFKPPEMQDIGDWENKVQTVIIEKLMDLDTDRIDFAEVGFFSFIALEARTQRRHFIGETEKRDEFIELDRPNEEGHDFELVSRGLTTEESLMLREGMHALPENLRRAVILYHFDGWQIESQDPDEPTISRLFGVSSRTIRNWLKEAKRILAEHIGGER